MRSHQQHSGRVHERVLGGPGGRRRDEGASPLRSGGAAGLGQDEAASCGSDGLAKPSQGLPGEGHRQAAGGRSPLGVLTLALLAVLAAAELHAQERPLFGVTFDGGKQAVSLPLQVTLLLAALTLLPAVVMSVTPFLRITIVLHFLRQSLGTQNTPSNQVLLGLALFLTSLIMSPVIAEIREKAWQPFAEGKLTQSQALAEAAPTVKKFLLRYAREKDVQLLLEIARKPAPASADQLELSVLAPAYILSELKAGFQIGAVLFLPFLVIDIVVASVTLSIGMVQLPPVMLSAPFKILLFVLVDGWNLLVGSLVKSFYA